MEQIMISIKGNGEQEQTARLMKAIYKTMARTNKAGCQVTVSSRREDVPEEHAEIKVPEFMIANRAFPQPAERAW